MPVERSKCRKCGTLYWSHQGHKCYAQQCLACRTRFHTTYRLQEFCTNCRTAKCLVCGTEIQRRHLTETLCEAHWSHKACSHCHRLSSGRIAVGGFFLCDDCIARGLMYFEEKTKTTEYIAQKKTLETPNPTGAIAGGLLGFAIAGPVGAALGATLQGGNKKVEVTERVPVEKELVEYILKRQCPLCKELVLPDAKVCKHCHNAFPD